MDLTILADLWEYLTVERHVPGRLSLKVDLGVRNHPRAADLSGAASGVDAIRKTRLNIFTRVLTVDYDTERLPFDLLQNLLTCPDRETMRAMARDMRLA